MWGTKVIDRLSADLRDAFPEMNGLSPRNLLFMRSFAAAYPEPEIVKQLVSQLPWGHIIRILQQIKDPSIRHWYVKACIAHGWSRNILDLQIKGQIHQRTGKAVNNRHKALGTSEGKAAAAINGSPMAHSVKEDILPNLR
jgi:predicted nuclease of restriction endonuclease-like (RecB) superfamily